MHRIDAEIAGTDLADDGIEIRAVAIDVTASGMDRIGNRLHVRLEQAAGIGIGDHHTGDIRPQPRLQRFEINTARGIGGNILDLVTGKGCGRRIGAMGAFRHEDHFASIAARFQRSPDTQDTAQLAMRASLGRHRHAMHAGQLDQPDRQFVDHAERALHAVDRLQRMDVGKALQPRDLLVEPRIMFHRAAAEREQADVDRVILAAEPCIVTDRLALGQTGNSDRRLALEPAEAAFDLRGLGQIDAAAIGRTDFKDQRFVDHQGAVAGVGGDGILVGHGHIGFLFGRASFGKHAHDRAPSRAVAKASISPSVEVSVTATSNP